MSRKKTVETDVVDSIAENLFIAQMLLRKRLLHLDAAPEAGGLPVSNMQILIMLNKTGAMSVSEISGRLSIAKPNITPMVDRLAEKGYVERLRDTEDRRVVNVAILEAGREKLVEIREGLRKQVAEWYHDISAADMKSLSDSLQNLTDILPQVQRGQPHDNEQAAGQ